MECRKVHWKESPKDQSKGVDIGSGKHFFLVPQRVPDRGHYLVMTRKLPQACVDREGAADCPRNHWQVGAWLSAVCGILGSGEQTRIESCIIRIPESMVESHIAHLTKYGLT
jgi:hypothetical protein